MLLDMFIIYRSYLNVVRSHVGTYKTVPKLPMLYNYKKKNYIFSLSESAYNF